MCVAIGGMGILFYPEPRTAGATESPARCWRYQASSGLIYKHYVAGFVPVLCFAHDFPGPTQTRWSNEG